MSPGPNVGRGDKAVPNSAGRRFEPRSKELGVGQGITAVHAAERCGRQGCLNRARAPLWAVRVGGRV